MSPRRGGSVYAVAGVVMGIAIAVAALFSSKAAGVVAIVGAGFFAVLSITSPWWRTRNPDPGGNRNRNRNRKRP